jgi:hypothetical protein
MYVKTGSYGYGKNWSDGSTKFKSESRSNGDTRSLFTIEEHVIYAERRDLRCRQCQEAIGVAEGMEMEIARQTRIVVRKKPQAGVERIEGEYLRGNFEVGSDDEWN